MTTYLMYELCKGCRISDTRSSCICSKFDSSRQKKQSARIVWKRLGSHLKHKARSVTNLLANPVTPLFVCPFIHSFIHSFIHALTHSLTHSFIHSRNSLFCLLCSFLTCLFIYLCFMLTQSSLLKSPPTFLCFLSFFLLFFVFIRSPSGARIHL